MIIPPKYQLTRNIVGLVSAIDAKRLLLEFLPIEKPVRDKIQRISLLKSSLFSARIEGNPLSFDDIKKKGLPEKKVEIFNILEGIRFIEKEIKAGSKTSQELILALHKIVGKSIFPDAGSFRAEMGAIFNEAGVAVYLAPPPDKIRPYLKELSSYINSEKEPFPLVNAFVSHLVFEKIHPFIDGNGRVGRLLITAILKAKGWQPIVSVPFEEYIDNHKDAYYYFLDRGLTQTEEYLEFMLTAFLEQTQKVISDLEKEKSQPLLPPRQDEIYQIIRDRRMVSFDIVRRRFLKVPERTLRYDLSKLQKMNLVVKIGKTRGAFYTVKS